MVNQVEFNKLKEKVDILEFQLEHLYNSSNISDVLYDYKVTRKQFTEIDNLIKQIDKNLEHDVSVTYQEYERLVLEIMNHTVNLNFPEYLLRAYYYDVLYEEVFSTLYKDFPKYEKMLKQL